MMSVVSFLFGLFGWFLPSIGETKNPYTKFRYTVYTFLLFLFFCFKNSSKYEKLIPHVLCFVPKSKGWMNKDEANINRNVFFFSLLFGPWKKYYFLFRLYSISLSLNGNALQSFTLHSSSSWCGMVHNNFSYVFLYGGWSCLSITKCNLL